MHGLGLARAVMTHSNNWLFRVVLEETVLDETVYPLFPGMATSCPCKV